MLREERCRASCFPTATLRVCPAFVCLQNAPTREVVRRRSCTLDAAALGQNEVVAMDDLRLVDVAKNVFYLLAGAARDTP